MLQSVYKAYNRNQAMNIAMAVAQSDEWRLNDEASKNYGMPVYYSSDGCRIFDGSRQEFPCIKVETDDGPDGISVYSIDIVGGEEEDFSEMQSQIMCVRTYINGCSRDIWNLVEDETDRLMIKTIISGAIACFIGGYTDSKSAADVAEWQAIKYFKGRNPEVNCYDTIYTPIRDFCAMTADCK